MVEAAVPTLVYDPGIKGLSWIGNVLVSIGHALIQLNQLLEAS